MTATLHHGLPIHLTVPNSFVTGVEAGVTKVTIPDPAVGGNTLTIGDGLGSPTLKIAKSDAGTSALEFDSNAKKRWTVGLDASENLTISRFNSSEVLQAAASFNASTGMAVLPNGLTVSAGGVTIAAGGLTVVAGGASVRGGLTVENTGLVVSAGGAVITAGGLQVNAGLTKLTLTNYADDAAAGTAGLTAGQLYRTAGAVMVKT